MSDTVSDCLFCRIVSGEIPAEVGCTRPIGPGIPGSQPGGPGARARRATPAHHERRLRGAADADDVVDLMVLHAPWRSPKESEALNVVIASCSMSGTTH